MTIYSIWDLDNLGWKITTVAALASITSAIYAMRNFYAGKRRDRESKEALIKANERFRIGEDLKDMEHDIEVMRSIRFALRMLTDARSTREKNPTYISDGTKTSLWEMLTLAKYVPNTRDKREIRHPRHSTIAEKLDRLAEGTNGPETSSRYSQELRDMIEVAIAAYEKEKREWIESHKS